MPSNTEKSRKRREKIRNDQEKHDKHKEKDRIRKKQQRDLKRATMTTEQQDEMRRMDREAKRKQRVKKAASKENVESCVTPENKSSPYSSASSLGRAISRVTNMPRSPTRKAHLLGKMVLQLPPTKRSLAYKCIQEGDPPAKKRLILNEKKQSDALLPETVKKVKDFYEQDDISRMSPGKKDFVSVKESTGRVRHQKRLLLLNISEAHQSFCEENTDIKIGLTKFGELRPPYVMPMTNRDHDVCLCRYHENVDLLAQGLRKVSCTPLPTNSDELVKKTVCSIDDEQCVNRTCDNCGVEMLDDYFNPDNKDTDVHYYQWNITDGHVTKQHLASSQSKTIQELYKQLDTFARHVYDAKRQHSELKRLKANLKPGEIILHEDFSENYTLKHQHEIQAAHWNQNSATLFTAIVYYRSDEEADLQHLSYTIISDDLDHGKHAVYAFNREILSDVKPKLPWNIIKVHYWSDGAASQFKNRFTLTNLTHHGDDFSCAADWSFFATAHGKGPIDGIGGEVKRSVWKAVLQGREVVGSPQDFFEVARKLCRKITVLYVNAEKIKMDTSHLELRWKYCKRLKGIQSAHFVCPNGREGVNLGRNSPFTCDQPLIAMDAYTTEYYDEVPTYLETGNEPQPILLETGIENGQSSEPISEMLVVKSGDYAKVKFSTSKKSEKLFIGLILRDDHPDYEVKCLRACDTQKKTFSFPELDDISWVTIEQVIQVLDMPSMDKRGRARYIFTGDVEDAE